MSAHACTEDQLVEQPAIGLFAEPALKRDLLLPRLLSGQVALAFAGQNKQDTESKR